MNLAPCREPLAIASRRDPEASLESPGEIVCARETHRRSDPFDRPVCAAEMLPRDTQAEILDVLRRRAAKGRSEAAGELAWTESYARREGGYRDIAGKMSANPGDQVREGVGPADLITQGLRVLLLSARPLEVDNHLPRHCERGLRSEVFLDQREREVDAGGNAA